MNKIIIKVNYLLLNKRLDNFLFNFINKISKNKLYILIRKGIIKVNNKIKLHSYKLKINDYISIIKNSLIKQNKNKLFYISNNLIKKIKILYEDKSILILNKPLGISAHGDIKNNIGLIELLRTLKYKEKFLELVHRIDKNTSGLIIIAKSRCSLLYLHEKIKKNEIKKIYLAILKEKIYFNYIIKAPLLKIKNNLKINKKGKNSESIFLIKKNLKKNTLVLINPIQGRTHQIRLHAKYIKKIILGDNLYDNNKYNNKLLLHAWFLIFKHPETKKYLFIEAPINKYFLKYI